MWSQRRKQRPALPNRHSSRRLRSQGSQRCYSHRFSARALCLLAHLPRRSVAATTRASQSRSHSEGDSITWWFYEIEFQNPRVHWRRIQFSSKTLPIREFKSRAAFEYSASWADRRISKTWKFCLFREEEERIERWKWPLRKTKAGSLSQSRSSGVWMLSLLLSLLEEWWEWQFDFPSNDSSIFFATKVGRKGIHLTWSEVSHHVQIRIVYKISMCTYFQIYTIKSQVYIFLKNKKMK